MRNLSEPCRQYIRYSHIAYFSEVFAAFSGSLSLVIGLSALTSTSDIPGIDIIAIPLAAVTAGVAFSNGSHFRRLASAITPQLSMEDLRAIVGGK